tara:strand:- start:186 stop:512 length:327 start_codon:yes stop_codon:yes gene_type:complete
MLSNWQSVLKARPAMIAKAFKKAVDKYILTLKKGDKKTLQKVQKELAPFYREELINDGMRPSAASNKVKHYKGKNYQKIVGNYLRNYSNIIVYANTGQDRRASMEVIE